MRILNTELSWGSCRILTFRRGYDSSAVGHGPMEGLGLAEMLWLLLGDNDLLPLALLLDDNDALIDELTLADGLTDVKRNL